MDGTFSVSPAILKQVYVIRVPLGESAVTCVCTPTTLPSPAATTSASTQIQQPALFVLATIQAIHSNFSENVTTQGCFYHLTQCTWCKIHDLALSHCTMLTRVRYARRPRSTHCRPPAGPGDDGDLCGARLPTQAMPPT